jgi:hypothetical protein
MGSHGFVRTRVGRWAALVVVVLLVAGAAPPHAAEPGAVAVPDAGMNPASQPVPTISAALPATSFTLVASIPGPARTALPAPRADRTSALPLLLPRAERVCAPSILRI